MPDMHHALVLDPNHPEPSSLDPRAEFEIRAREPERLVKATKLPQDLGGAQEEASHQPSHIRDA